MEDYSDIHILRTQEEPTPQYKKDLFNRFAKCQTAEMGGRILVCDDCGNRIVKYNSCNTRGCYKCAPGKQLKWRAKTMKHVLPCGHFHQIFKVPTDQLYYLWKIDKKRFVKMMFRSVQRAYKKEFKQMGITPGVFMVFQSHGERICVQLHVHCAVSMGGVTKDGHWVPIKKLNEERLESNRLLKNPYFPLCNSSLQKDMTFCRGTIHSIT